MAATFRVTQSNIVKTAAERRLPDTDAVLTLLKWVEKHFGKRAPKQCAIDPKLSSGVSSSVKISVPESNGVASLII